MKEINTLITRWLKFAEEDITKDEAEHAIETATEIEKYITEKIVL